MAHAKTRVMQTRPRPMTTLVSAAATRSVCSDVILVYGVLQRGAGSSDCGICAHSGTTLTHTLSLSRALVHARAAVIQVLLFPRQRRDRRRPLRDLPFS